MQVSAVSSNNFGNSYYEIAKNDIEKAEQLSQFLRDYNNSNLAMYDEDAPRKKNVLGVATSIVVGALAIFGLTKKGLNGAESVLNSIKETKIASKFGEIVTNSKITQKTVEIAKNLEGKAANKIDGNKILSSVAKYAKAAFQKVGAKNIIAGATSIGATTYVAHTDGNSNGIPDIAEKGVNAYKNALNHMDAIKEVVDLIS